jgi:predicted alpha/beta hydrolase
MNDDSAVERLDIPALDGYPLCVRRFQAERPRRCQVVVAGATAVPQNFYRAFAEYLRIRGYEVTTFDYRGIGESSPSTLRGFRMDYRDWGRLDLAGVLRHVAGQGSVHLVGHSYGGHALGLQPDLSIVSSLHAYGTGSGWHGWMPRTERLRVHVMWNVLGPVLVRSHGYLAWKQLGLGQDLPVDVYRQWKAWCRYPRYWFDDPDVGEEMAALFARVTVPISAINSVDDRWSSPAARDAFFSGYARAPVTVRDLRPADIEQASIGHMGYFRRGSERLWDDLLADLEAMASKDDRPTDKERAP